MADQVQVEVGMGATKYVGSDRYPFTVVKILSPKRIVVQMDKATRTDSNGLSEQQEYQYEPNPNGSEYTISLRKDGRWYEVGQPAKWTCFIVGHRSMHQDPHF
jgi:hypothetical protein